MSEMIRRATEYTAEGRTLLGVAYHFERPSRVTDPGRAPYLEAFSRGSATKTIREHPSIPVDYFHGLVSGTAGARSRWAGMVFGSSRFANGADGLEFTATISRTRDGDEMLELIRDEALGDVSIYAQPVKTATRDGVVWRDEVALKALSLAPIGLGQHAGAKVLAMRTAGDELPGLAALRRRKSLLVSP